MLALWSASLPDLLGGSAYLPGTSFDAVIVDVGYRHGDASQHVSQRLQKVLSDLGHGGLVYTVGNPKLAKSLQAFEHLPVDLSLDEVARILEADLSP